MENKKKRKFVSEWANQKTKKWLLRLAALVADQFSSLLQQHTYFQTTRVNLGQILS